MKATVTFEEINGYLIRIYPSEVNSTTKINYKGILTADIDKDVAVLKGLHGEISHRNASDIFEYLRNNGVKVATWERYNSSGELRSSKTIKLI